MSVKDMVLHCSDFGLMRRLSCALVKDYSAEYTSNTCVEYEVMHKERIPSSSLYINFIKHYDFYKQSDELWEWAKRFCCNPDNAILVLYFDDCIIICQDMDYYNYIDSKTLYQYNPLYISWEKVECFLKGE